MSRAYIQKAHERLAQLSKKGSSVDRAYAAQTAKRFKYSDHRDVEGLPGLPAVDSTDPVPDDIDQQSSSFLRHYQAFHQEGKSMLHYRHHYAALEAAYNQSIEEALAEKNQAPIVDPYVLSNAAQKQQQTQQNFLSQPSAARNPLAAAESLAREEKAEDQRKTELATLKAQHEQHRADLQDLVQHQQTNTDAHLQKLEEQHRENYETLNDLRLESIDTADQHHKALIELQDAHTKTLSKQQQDSAQALAELQSHHADQHQQAIAHYNAQIQQFLLNQQTARDAANTTGTQNVSSASLPFGTPTSVVPSPFTAYQPPPAATAPAAASITQKLQDASAIAQSSIVNATTATNNSSGYGSLIGGTPGPLQHAVKKVLSPVKSESSTPASTPPPTPTSAKKSSSSPTSRPQSPDPATTAPATAAPAPSTPKKEVTPNVTGSPKVPFAFSSPAKTPEKTPAKKLDFDDTAFTTTPKSPANVKELHEMIVDDELNGSSFHVPQNQSAVSTPVKKGTIDANFYITGGDTEKRAYRRGPEFQELHSFLDNHDSNGKAFGTAAVAEQHYRELSSLLQGAIDKGKSEFIKPTMNAGTTVPSAIFSQFATLLEHFHHLEKTYAQIQELQKDKTLPQDQAEYLQQQHDRYKEGLDSFQAYLPSLLHGTYISGQKLLQNRKFAAGANAKEKIKQAVEYANQRISDGGY